MIGRVEEKRRLIEAFQSRQSEFVTVYGRRRIGKTYLVNEVLGKKFAFHHAGLKRGNLKSQLSQFRLALMRQGCGDCPQFKTWLEHIPQMKKALGISGVSTAAYAWREQGDAKRRGAQIDLLIDRKDDIVNRISSRVDHRFA